ncbi:hypothetical protein [Halobaculum sp. EA56]|uniref:hypothetical protein n=1 Tax=Halobaculum sp. EA56 TaxID=3421648 RepID=UPI003EBFDBB7
MKHKQGETPAAPSKELSTDDLFQSFANRTRRSLLTRLVSEGRIRIDEIASEADDPGTKRLELRHNHLPKLESRGIIRWEDSDRVVPGEQFDRVAAVVELLHGHSEELDLEWR